MKQNKSVQKHKYYVCMTDKFMSGWGYAQDKINKLVIVCDTYEEAETVKQNAQDRSEMIYININIHKPYYNENRYFVSWAGRGQENEYKMWFSEDRPWKKV